MKQPYLIAEIGINHNGDMDIAKKLIDATNACGWHCVKFQKFIADDYISRYAQKAGYQKRDKKVVNKSQLEIIKSCELNINQLKILKKFCKKQKIDFLCTTFEQKSLSELLKIKEKKF